MFDDAETMGTTPIPWDPRAIDWKEIEELRKQPGIEKMYQSLRLQEMARGMSILGIRNQNPGASPDDVQRIFSERMELFWKLDERDKRD